MHSKELKAQDLQAMFEVGANRLTENVDYVNALNVFPVPDGDTGTNMNLSFTSGVDQVIRKQSQTAGEIAADLAKGLLMGARGNSGVILSQLFRGFAKALEDLDTVNAKQLGQAFSQGVETAYKAVMKPVEGTILTVAREAAEAGQAYLAEGDDPVELMRQVQAAGQVALDNTPNLLPVLAEVGVVDSGGQGLLFIYTGFLESLTGEAVPSQPSNLSQADVTEIAHHEHHFDTAHAVNTEDIKFGYCTEIMVRLKDGPTYTDEFDYDSFRNYLNDLGDSLLVVNDDEIVKVHVHTETPGEVMNYGQKFGSLIKIKVDNMREQHDALLDGQGSVSEAIPVSDEKPAKYGIIAVAAGQGIQDLFKSMGATNIINGGQTMNPSTEDILKAIDQANAENIIILPNNKNIFMAAEQAAQVADMPCAVIPSRTISQGITALLAYNGLAELADNQAAMTEELAFVKSGQITNAVRDTQIDGLTIKKDDFMGIVEGDIKVADADLASATQATIAAMLDEDSEIVTLIIGDQGDQAQAEAIIGQLQIDYPEVEYEIVQGDQPVYHYLVSVE
ncbi:hypothetical protein SAMN04487985_11412 [Aerococcus urinaehominis]|nr:hypothetical protein SAMN04487985_11412 [Aerococcus urinaehominis]